MPPLTALDKALILDHVVGDPTFPAAFVGAVLAKFELDFPSDPTPRFARGLLLRHLAADPVSATSLKVIQHLASAPASVSPSPVAAAAHIAVAAFLAASAPDFDAAATELRRAVDCPALASDVVAATVGQFEAAVGNSSSQTILKALWGNQAFAEERVRDFLAAEWAAIEPSKLLAAAERIVGDGAVETWRAADEATRAKLRILAGEEKSREILAKLEEPNSSANPISTPAVEKVIDTPKTSCADLHSVVEDPLSAVKAVADEVLAARTDKGVSLNAEEVRGQPTTCGAACLSTLNDKGKGPSIKPRNLMDWNHTAQTSQWVEPPDVEGPSSPHLPLSRSKMPRSPLPPPKNKSKPKSQKRWSLVEEEALRKGVQEHGVGNWKGILDANVDVFNDRSTMNLKDKWRNMTR